MINTLLLPLLVLATLASTITADDEPTKCTWQNCPKTEPDLLNVHIICHTHDDLGWLKTVDQYYYGSKKLIVEVGVQYILNTVVKELEGHPDRRFSYAETGFFWRWYMNQHDFVKHQVKKLVNNGQLEFIGGGWAQNDEAASHYVEIIDQMTLGLNKLNQTFGECGRPKVAWQIDPFGHSREQASLFAQMGYEALFFARIHYLEKAARLADKSLEFVWNGSDDLKTNILTGAFYNDNYGPPPGFCFDALCGDDPIMDNPKMEGYNVDQKVDDFIAFVKEQAGRQRTNHVMVLMGSDFQYTNADAWYSNLDKLIRYVNEKQSTAKVNLFYSTPSCYVQALNAAGPKLPTKSDDFFPYASSNHSYWTGYFTSRPTFKSFVRQSSSLLQVCKQLDTNANLGPADFGDLNVLMNAVALSQHHDAITGTAKENVTRDYEKRLFHGWMEGQQVINDAVAKLIPKSPETPVPKQVFCPLSNISVCDVTEANGQFTVTVFNGQAKATNTTIRIPYYWRAATALDFNGATVSTQVIKTFAPVYQLANINASPYELIIPVQVGPLGFATYFVSNKTSETSSSISESVLMDLETLIIEDYIEEEEEESESSNDQVRDPMVLQNELIQITFDSSGLVSKFTDLKSKFSMPLTQEFLWYKGYGDDRNQQLSGAYIFRPNGTVPIKVTNEVKVELITGPLVNEVRQTFSPWVSQVIRLYKGKPYAEFEWTVGPIPKEKDNPITKEVITRFTTTISNGGVFYTDANGRQMVTRTRNHAPMYRYENTEPVAANYYPVNSRIYIKDDRAQITILTDRSQGGASLVDGQVELMIHRRSFFDDGFGVDEALDEPGVDGRGLVARGRHWLIIAPPANSAALHRRLAYDLFYTPILTFAPLTATVDQYRQTFNTQFAGLRRSLPDNINLLTLEQWERRSLLVRFEHTFQNGEDRELSQPTTISLKDLFTTFDVVSARELTLGANNEVKSNEDQWARRMNRWSTRYRWRGDMNVNLIPMQIRTFQIEVQQKKASRRRAH